MARHAAPSALPKGNPGDPLSVATSERDRSIVENVRRALENEKAFLLYQPVVDARRTGRVAFYEGLIRTMDDTGRVIPAKDFIEQVEDKAEGRMIDCLALKLGLQTLAQREDIRLSINMSARSIGFPRWMDTFRDFVARYPHAAERLIVEITESSAMAAPESTQAFMESLQDKGVAFAMDDFGAGFTSLKHLRDLNFDVVKFDRGFITDIDRDPDNQACIMALQTLATHFDMFTVAEGIERPKEAETLARFGVDCFQGYLYGAPAALPEREERARKSA